MYRAPPDSAQARVVLGAAHVAVRIARDIVPSEQDLFYFAAAIANAAIADNEQALDAGRDFALELVSQIPSDAAWEGTAGCLWTTAAFAWLLRHRRGAAERGAAEEL